jgi:hypothetical protein
MLGFMRRERYLGCSWRETSWMFMERLLMCDARFMLSMQALEKNMMLKMMMVIVALVVVLGFLS